MRPLRLKMQAFGPFPSEVEIPFENLGQGNIYLISGVTGSGKTTIFDAICYALFNTSSGSNRGTTTLKSHFAKDNVESFVEFCFLFNGEEYKIIRYPSCERKKAKGEGTIVQQAKAQLFLPDGKIIEKVKEVDEYIIELLGINAAQFSQIALLAQGEFLKLLNADTSTRAEIFRNIFKTWNFANFQNKLKEKMLFYKNEYENLNASILQYFSDVICTDEQISQLKDKYLLNGCFDDLSIFIKLLNHQNENDDKFLEKIKKDVLILENKIKISQNDFLKIQNKINLKTQKANLEAENKKINTIFSNIKKDYENLKNDRLLLKDYSTKIEKLENDYKKAIQIKEFNLLSDKLKLQIEEKTAILKEIKEKIIEFKINHLKCKSNEYLKFRLDKDNAQKEFLEFEEVTKNISLEYVQKYNEYLKMQAGIIAKDLKENEPCPVCGSLKHPNIAKLENIELNKEIIDALKQKCDSANLKLADLSKLASILLEREKFQKSDFEKLSKKYDLKIEIDKYQVDESDFDFEITKLEGEIEKNKEEIASLESESKVVIAKIQTLMSDLKNINPNEIIIQNNDLKEKYKTLEQKIENIESDYLKISQELNANKSKIELLSVQLNEFKGINEDNFEKITSEIKSFEGEISKLDESTKQILVRKSINDKVCEALKIKNREFIKISDTYKDYKILSNCANGNLKGNARIPFEQYIQGYYLDLVLFEANKRLRLMSQNQFQLLRKKDITSLQGKTGLDLEVMDFHTFKKRSTKTLSGGESFKAALSLALGLCDCVSNFSGATNMESMFIDEGFGSLDSESLDLAMDVIFNLTNGNRLIGIISHIEDLKSKIQNQILTYKTQNGSLLELNF